MKCNNCGSENESYARFCVECGSAITSESQSQYTSVYPQNSLDMTQEIPIQPSHSYKQPEPPEKKGKAGKIIAVIIALLLLVGIGVGCYFAVRNGWVEVKFNFGGQEESLDEQVQYFNLNIPIHTAGVVEISLFDKYIQQGAVKPSEAAKDYDTPLFAKQDSDYIVVVADIKNVSKNNIDFNNICIECILDGKYDLSELVEVYYEINAGTELSTNSIIEPDETKKAYFVCSVPNDYIEAYESFVLTFGFDSKLSSKPLTQGMEACDYIFKFAAQ